MVNQKSPITRAPKQTYAINETFLKRGIERPTAEEKSRFYFDKRLIGFGVKVYSSGTIVFGVRFNLPGGKSRWVVIGKNGNGWHAQSARDDADKIKRNVGEGRPPLAHRAAVETAMARMQDLADKYFAHMDELVESENISEKTIKKYRRQWKKNVPKFLKLKYLSEVDITDFTRAHRDITKRGVKKTKRPVEANRTMAMLSSMLNWVLGLPEKKRMGLTENHVLPLIKNPERKDRGIALEDAQQARLICFLNDPLTRRSVWWNAERKARRIARASKQKREELRQPPYCLEDQLVDALLLLFLTGLRSWEVKAMRWADIGEQGEILKTLRTKQGAGPTTEFTFKDTFLTEEALKVIDRIPRDSEWVFPSRGRSKESASGHIANLQDAWERVRKYLDLPKVRLHDLRHTMASELTGTGKLGVKELQAAMGWESSQTALRYMHAYEAKLKASVQEHSTERMARLAVVQNAMKTKAEETTQPQTEPTLPPKQKRLKPIKGLLKESAT